MASLQTQLERLKGLTDTKDVTDWENKFIKSILEQVGPNLNTRVLSGNQCEKIEQIFDKHFAA